MKEVKLRYRLTIKDRRPELTAVLKNALIEHDRRERKLIHTYPHGSAAERMADAVIDLEKGEPHLLMPGPLRLERMATAIVNAHREFDRENKWSDGYDHDKAGVPLAHAVSRAEITL